MKDAPLAMRRRGMSLMLVTTVVAAASVIAWAVLSVATRDSMVANNRQAAVEARYAAESGVSLGMYYLENPSAAPTLVAGPDGQSHFPGETGMALHGDDSEVDITVTPVEPGLFRIESVARAGAGDSVSLGRAHALVYMRREAGTSQDALLANGSINLPRGMSVTGDVVSNGTLDLTNVSERQLVLVPDSPVLTYDQLLIIQQLAIPADGTGTTDRTYVWKGQTYRAQRLPSTVNGTLVGDPVTNPANVWYTNTSVRLANADINGTNVVRHAKSCGTLEIDGNTRIRAHPGMPAVVTGHGVELRNRSSLEVDGIMWVGEQIKSPASHIHTRMVVRGALMLASESFVFSGNPNVPISIEHDEAAPQAGGLRALLPKPEITAVLDVTSRAD
jgi:hypothetical protein